MSCATDYNELFASRFSAEDAEFQGYVQRASDAPPVLEDWRAARARRDRRFPEQRHHHHRPHPPAERRWERNSGPHGHRPHY